MLVLKNIMKKDGSEKGGYIFDNLNFHLYKNEYVEIIAEDHESLDALVKILALIDDDYKGEYFFDGILASNLSEKELSGLQSSNIGLVVGKLNLINELTLGENLELPFLYNKGLAVVQKVTLDQLLKKFNLLHRRDHYPSNLSSFIKLKAAIAQATALGPKLLIIEYDPDNLSVEDHLELTNLLFSLNEEGLTILVLINKIATSSLVHRRLFMKEGKILSD